jgi:hypothetical protein
LLSGLILFIIQVNKIRGIKMEEAQVNSGLRKKLISAGLIIITLATVAVQMFLLKKTDKKNELKTSTEAIMVDPHN